MRIVLLDTGPVVALLYRQDPHRRATVEALTSAAGAGRRTCTTWEVVSEAYTFMRMRLAPRGQAHPALRVLAWAWESAITILGTTDEDHKTTAEILEQNADVRLSYVDALLLAVSGRHEAEELVTIDASHFRAVRPQHTRLITVV